MLQEGLEHALITYNLLWIDFPLHLLSLILITASNPDMVSAGFEIEYDRELYWSADFLVGVGGHVILKSLQVDDQYLRQCDQSVADRHFVLLYNSSSRAGAEARLALQFSDFIAEESIHQITQSYC